MDRHSHETLVPLSEASFWPHPTLFFSQIAVSPVKLVQFMRKCLKDETAKCERKRVECDHKLAPLSGCNVSFVCPGMEVGQTCK